MIKANILFSFSNLPSFTVLLNIFLDLIKLILTFDVLLNTSHESIGIAYYIKF